MLVVQHRVQDKLDRPAVDSISSGVLPDAGMTFEIPKITAVPTVGEEAEEATIDETGMTNEFLSVSVKKYAGGQEFSVELLDRSSPAFFDELVRQMEYAYSLATDKFVAAQLLSDTEEFGKFSSFVDKKLADRSLTTPLKKVWQYIKNEIDTKEGAVPWQRLRYLRREIADKLSPTPEVSFGLLKETENKNLIKEIDDLLDSFVGGTKSTPGSYKKFLEGYKDKYKYKSKDKIKGLKTFIRLKTKDKR